MPEFTIYSIGDSAFLEQILIAVAMITGTNDFTKMVSVGLLIGVVMITVQSVFQGAKQINIQQIFMGWLLYACFFVPTSLVKIEDAYTGQVRPVANVPIGIGFAGGVISNVGYTLTKLFETGYGIIVPNVTETHFSETLKLLNDVRRGVYDSAIFTALNQDQGGGYVDVRRSVSNYIRECTLTKVDLNLMSLDELLTLPLDQALQFNSSLYGTRVYLNASNPDGGDFTCSEAWSTAEGVGIVGALNNLSGSNVNNALNNLLGVDPTYTGVNALTKIADSLQAVGAISTSAVEYTKVALLEPLYYEAAAGRYQDLQDYGSALMINQAIQQRNTQWAAEQSMFMSVVRPMLTFFEGFVYAITPIMGFIIVMGSMGMTLAGKYFQTVLWIQLWMPVLSITNLFIHTAATNEMASLSTPGLNSMYALSSTGDILQNWIATGGMLAAATPIISLFIVTGSTYAFTSLANRVNGSDHVNEKIQSPDALNQGPVMNSQPAYNHNQFSGTMATGAESLISTFSLGSSIGSGVSSARALQSQKSEAFSDSLGRGFAHGVSQDQAYSRLASIGRTIGSQNTQQSQLVNQQAKNFMDKFQVDDQHADAVKGAFGMQAIGSLDVKEAAAMVMPLMGTARAAVKNAVKGPSKGTGLATIHSEEDGAKGGGGDIVGLTAQAQGKTESSATDTSTWSASDVSQFMKNVSLGKTDSQALTNQLAHGINRQGGESFKQSWGDNLSQNLSKSAQELVSATNAYTTMDQLQNSMGSMTNSDFKTLGGEVARSPEAMDYLNQHYQNAPDSVRKEAANLEQRYRGYGMDPGVAKAAARLTAMTNTNNYQPGQQVGGFQAAVSAINLATGRNSGFESDPLQYSGLTPPTVPENLGQTVGSNVGSGPVLPSNFRENTISTSGTAPVTETPPTPPVTPVTGEHDANLQQLGNLANQTNRAVSSPEEQKARNNMLNALPDMSWSASTWGAVDNTGDWLARRAEQVGGAAVAGGQATASDFSNAMDQLRTMTPEQRDQFIEATQRGDDYISEEYGFGGEMAVAAAKLGRNVIGAAASGYNAAKEWLTGESDLSEAAKGMSLEQRGAFYAAATASAAEAGGSAAANFMEQYGDEFKQTMAELGTSRYGLTNEQAAVYAESFDTNQDRMSQAVNNLKMQYAETDANGSVMMNEDGSPVLSQQNQEFTDQLVNVLQNAGDAGDRSGSYLTAVRGYNIANQQFD
ncbi:conjugal transfer protein TraG N-terminal domain-containing protein [Vibrio sp. SG41-7]|uniref:conjugal transfer protein TraG N-terminal domain-containing protein n=1 Tax=Vibrio sp. SG41-7 TaxID=2760973 RepID=UPI0016027DF4|nr:conjugal transfer protein TraG N-terminal domain-containing protein [Vibrio sp. SG41-7]MBB1466060.1 conjugal transfer protein TraG N-terminal domain-containing protein [Vibrio sp. SG41-7]